MMDSWIAPTISPPPLSGSSLMPFESQVDQHTGMAEFSAPQANMAERDASDVISNGKQAQGDGSQRERQPASKRIEMPRGHGAGSVRADESSHAKRKQQQRKLRNVHVGVGFKKRPQVGERGERARKGEHDSEHGERDIAPLEQPEELAYGIGCLRRHCVAG